MKTPSRIGWFLAPLSAALVLLLALVLSPQVFASREPSQLHGLSLAVPASGVAPMATLALVEMEVRDVVPLEEAQTHAVMLVAKDEQSVLPVFVDEESAIAIAFRLAHREAPLPLSADLLDKVISDMGGTVTEVRIDDVQAHVFTGRVFIQQGRKNLELDAPPSDSLAMALSSGARIFVSQRVMAEAGITQEEIERLEQEPGVGGSGPLEPIPTSPDDFHGQGEEISL